LPFSDLILQFVERHFAQPALLIPRHRNQIKETSAHSIPDSIFGNPCDSGSMVNGNFLGQATSAVDQDRQEAMQSVEWKYSIQRRALENSKSTARVGKIHSEHSFARPAGDPRGNASNDIILPFDPNATNEVALLQLRQQLGQIGRIILQIAIKRGQNGGRCGLKAGPKRGALPAIPTVFQSADPWFVPPGFPNPFPGPIGAAVIDKNQFDGTGLVAERDENLSNQRENVFGFVVNGNDDRNVTTHEISLIMRVRMGNGILPHTEKKRRGRQYLNSVAQPSRLRVAAAPRRMGIPRSGTGTVPKLSQPDGCVTCAIRDRTPASVFIYLL
jgi:hypothetical protein